MPHNIATTPQIDKLVEEEWINEGRFANRSEAFRAGIFALELQPRLVKSGQLVC